ncbi:hypothetical protein K504DRAFT_535500, partial [Pleomassaria siparia CBS 279.74]
MSAAAPKQKNTVRDLVQLIDEHLAMQLESSENENAHGLPPPANDSILYDGRFSPDSSRNQRSDSRGTIFVDWDEETMQHVVSYRNSSEKEKEKEEVWPIEPVPSRRRFESQPGPGMEKKKMMKNEHKHNPVTTLRTSEHPLLPLPLGTNSYRNNPEKQKQKQKVRPAEPGPSRRPFESQPGSGMEKKMMMKNEHKHNPVTTPYISRTERPSERPLPPLPLGADSYWNVRRSPHISRRERASEGSLPPIPLVENSYLHVSRHREREGEVYVEGYDSETAFHYDYDGRTIHVRKDPGHGRPNSTGTMSEYYMVDPSEYLGYDYNPFRHDEDEELLSKWDGTDIRSSSRPDRQREQNNKYNREHSREHSREHTRERTHTGRKPPSQEPSPRAHQREQTHNKAPRVQGKVANSRPTKDRHEPSRRAREHTTQREQTQPRKHHVAPRPTKEHAYKHTQSLKEEPRREHRSDRNLPRPPHTSQPHRPHDRPHDHTYRKPVSNGRDYAHRKPVPIRIINNDPRSTRHGAKKRDRLADFIQRLLRKLDKKKLR